MHVIRICPGQRSPIFSVSPGRSRGSATPGARRTTGRQSRTESLQEVAHEVEPVLMSAVGPNSLDIPRQSASKGKELFGPLLQCRLGVPRVEPVAALDADVHFSEITLGVGFSRERLGVSASQGVVIPRAVGSSTLLGLCHLFLSDFPLGPIWDYEGPKTGVSEGGYSGYWRFVMDKPFIAPDLPL